VLTEHLALAHRQHRGDLGHGQGLGFERELDEGEKGTFFPNLAIMENRAEGCHTMSVKANLHPAFRKSGPT
jgi:hypothetical protein